MIEKDFSVVMLDKKESKKIKKINKKKQIPYSDEYDSLIDGGYVEFTDYTFDGIGNHIPIKDHIRTTETGKLYLMYFKREKFRFYFPVALSVVSLLISAAAFVVSLLN